MMRLLTLFRLETVKLTHRKVFFLAFLALGLVSALFVWGFKEVHFNRVEYVAKMMGLNLAQLKNGLFCSEFALTNTFMVLLPIFASVIGGHLISSEAKEGTLRAVLVRPVGRLELAGVKFALAVAYLLAINVFFVGCTLAIAVPAYGSGDFLTLYYDRGVPPSVAVLTAAEGFTRMSLACLLAAGAMLPVIALAFMLSAMFDNPVVVTVGAIVSFLILQIFHELAQAEEMAIFKWMEPYLFNHYMGFWRKVFLPTLDWTPILKDFGTCAAFAGGFLAVGMGYFRWKDIRS